MKINIFDSRIKQRDLTAIQLNETDFHPCRPFFLSHPELLPESAEKVSIRGILEHTLYIRYVLKIADSLLKNRGSLEIYFFSTALDNGGNPFRVIASLMYELSICFKERFRLIMNDKNGNLHKLVFEKIRPTLPVEDSIDSWSFGIVSDGRKNNRVIEIINQIVQFSIPNFEILVCGPSPVEKLPEFVKVIDDIDLYFDDRIPISKKKNRIVKIAKYNNLILLHDRISFPVDWYKNISLHGNYFDCLCIRIIDEDTQLNRIQDWMGTSLDHYDFMKINPRINNLEYTDWVPNWNINGGFMIIKKHLIERVKLNPYLHWGECEDGDLCRRLDADGLCPTLFTGAYVLTQTHRLIVAKRRRGMLLFAQKLKGKIYSYWGFYQRKKLFRKYLSEVML
jgi:hypothetical protein